MENLKCHDIESLMMLVYKQKKDYNNMSKSVYHGYSHQDATIIGRCKSLLPTYRISCFEFFIRGLSISSY